jgi:transmembrane sensor
MVGFRQEALSYAKRTSMHLNKEPPRRGLRAAAIAAVLAIGLLGGVCYHWLQRPDDYATTFGERRVVALSDGSKISLDSDSEVTVRYTKAGRELHLLRGQARFDVAHDVERPFSVTAREQKVIATGTAFNIDMTQPKVLVTLIEGHIVVVDEDKVVHDVKVSHAAAPKRASVELRAGQQLAAVPDEAPVIQTADVTRAVAWTSGQLVFDDQPLSEVVARVNHYATTPIVITDERTAALHISGSFNTGDVTGFLDIVTRYLPVQEVTDDSGRIILHKK